MTPPEVVPNKRPTVAREIGTSFLLCIPIVALAGILASLVPASAFDSLPIENLHGTRRLIFFFVISYLIAVPYLVHRINRAAVKNPRRTRDLKLAAIQSVVLGPIVLMPALLLWWGPTAARRFQGFYLAAVHYAVGLWIVGAIVCFAAALVVWLIGYALKLDGKDP